MRRAVAFILDLVEIAVMAAVLVALRIARRLSTADEDAAP